MCVFCEIIEHRSEARIVYESSNVIAFLDADPIATGHVLVLPKKHVETITKVPEDTLLEIIKVARCIVEVFENKYGHKGYSIMQNGGECCDFGHFHLHVFPRCKGDGFGWTYPEAGGRCTAEIAFELSSGIEQKLQGYPVE